MTIALATTALPTGMYEGAGHGPLWWALYVAAAAVTVTLLMLAMLAGVARGASEGGRSTDEASDKSTTRASRDLAGAA